LAKLREEQPAMGQYISVDAFREFATDVFLAQNRQRNLYSQFEDHTARAMAESASALMYQDVMCTVASGENYSEWFATRGLETETLSPLELDLLANDILTQILGKDITGTSFLAELQKNMLELMSRLSSYTVQYLQSINNASYRILDIVMPRFSDIDSRYFERRYIDIHRINPTNHLIKVKHDIKTPRQSLRILGKSQSQGEEHIGLDLGLDVTLLNVPSVHYSISIGGVRTAVTSDVGV
jgi:hypothetical protein